MVMCALQWFLPCQSYYSLFLFHHPLQVFLTKWFDGGAFMNYAKEPESSVHWIPVIRSFRLYGQFLVGPERNWLSYNKHFRIYGQLWSEILDISGYMVKRAMSI